MINPTDEQRLFAAKFIECNCSVKETAEALGITYNQAECRRLADGVCFEVDRLLSQAGHNAIVSRGYVKNRLITIVERTMEGEPVLFKGEVVAGVTRFKPQAAIAALNTLLDHGFVEDVEFGDDTGELTNEDRANRVLELFKSRAVGGARPTSEDAERTG